MYGVTGIRFIPIAHQLVYGPMLHLAVSVTVMSLSTPCAHLQVD